MSGISTDTGVHVGQLVGAAGPVDSITAQAVGGTRCALLRSAPTTAFLD